MEVDASLPVDGLDSPSSGGWRMDTGFDYSYMDYGTKGKSGLFANDYTPVSSPPPPLPLPIL